MIGFLAWVYDTVANLAPVREKLALAHGSDILSLEHSLHIGTRGRPEPLARRPRHARGDPLLLLRQCPFRRHAWPARLAVVEARRHLPPAAQLLGGHQPDWSARVLAATPWPRRGCLSGFTDVIASSHTFGSWHTGSLAADANQFGAMPSLHIAWAAWCTFVLWRLSSRAWVRAVALALSCLTAFAVLATGNHYLLDLVGGLVTFALGLRRLCASPCRMSQSCY